MKTNIIIIDYVIRLILPDQLKKVSVCHKAVCGCECFISDKGVHSYLLTWRYSYLNKLKYHRLGAQNLISSKITSNRIETYNNAVMPHGSHIHIHQKMIYLSMSKNSC